MIKACKKAAPKKQYSNSFGGKSNKKPTKTTATKFGKSVGKTFAAKSFKDRA